MTSSRRLVTICMLGAVALGSSAAEAADPSSPTATPRGTAAAQTPAAGRASGGSALRDPFRPFSLALRPKVSDRPKTPLEQYDVGALKLVAVIYDTQNPKAMVEDDAGLGYSIAVGTAIGNAGGVVKNIEPDRVIVEEEFVDFYGEKKKTQIVLRLKPEGEKRP